VRSAVRAARTAEVEACNPAAIAAWLSATGAPNVIWILLDDVGYGASSTFGGGAHTPVLDSLAKNGLTYTNFNTTAVCSPSRAAMLTGRNHHMVSMGLLPQKLMSAEFPGYTGRLQPKDGTIADYMRERGYSTYMLGKWHLVPDEEATDLGPFDRRPTGKGFDHWLGFLGGAVDQYNPPLVEDNQHVEPPCRRCCAHCSQPPGHFGKRRGGGNIGHTGVGPFDTGQSGGHGDAPPVWLNAIRPIRLAKGPSAAYIAG
jgi:arylsulfatase A-like enzyme